MEKKRRKSWPLWAVCAAALLGVFLWPLSAFDLAWPFGGDPETVRIQYRELGGDALTIDVTLTQEESTELIGQLKNCRARFISPGRQSSFNTESYWIALSHSRTGWVEVSYDAHGTFSQQTPNLWKGRATFRLYPKGRDSFLEACREWTGPNSKYPGLIFLREFFAIGKDGRAEFLDLQSPDGVYGSSAIESLYAGIEPYMTEQGFRSVQMSRSLYNLEYICKQKDGEWNCCIIEVAPASEPGYYTYRVDLVESALGDSENLWIAGNYYVGEDGFVEQFYIDLPGVASQAE